MSLATPTLFLPQAFASSGAKNVIPTASASPLASLVDGFPAVTMQPLTSGGIPPEGQDMNGILNWITTLLAWANAGGLFPFNADLATAMSGYHKGAVLILNDGVTIVRNTSAGNTVDPNSALTNWVEIAGTHIPASGLLWDDTNATDQYTVTIVSGVLTISAV